MLAARERVETEADSGSYCKSTKFKMPLQQNFTVFIYNASHMLG